MTKYFSPTSDLVFKKVFASRQNADITIELLNTLLGKQEGRRIVHITFLETSNIPEIARNKPTHVDLRCQDEKGDQYIVEMQVGAEDSFFKRAQYYSAVTVSNQLIRATAYEALMPVYFIAILDFTLFKELTNYFNVFILKHDETNIVHHDTLGCYTFIELPKFKKKEKDLATHIDAWINLFKRADQEAQVPKQFESYAPIAKAYKELSAANYSPAEQRAYEKELDILRLEQGKLNTAIRQGHAEGKAEQALETAKSLLQDGLSVQKVMHYTGLDEQTIQEIKKNTEESGPN